MRILIVEDEIDIVGPLRKFLENNGYAVDFAGDGQEGTKLAELNSYDCILLDLNLPKIDGLSVADKLRKSPNTTPIIIVTARSQIYDKLEGFEHGADDYITKPFDLDELLARVNAVIKRNSINKIENLQIGEFEFFPEQNKLIPHDSQMEGIDLSNKESGILEYLIRNKGKIISAEKLLEHVWNQEVDSFTETVKTHIKTLRKKIDPDKTLIRTVRGKGYILN